MLVGARLRGGAGSGTRTSSGRGVEVGELLARPLGDHRDRRGRREFVPLGFAAEVYLDHDVPAVMAMHVPVPVDFKDLQGQVDIDGFVLIDPVLDLGGLLQGLVAFADEDENPVLALRHHVDPNQHIPQGVAEGGGGDLGLDALAVQKCRLLSRYLKGGARRARTLASAGAKCQCAFVYVGNIIADPDFAKKPDKIGVSAAALPALDNR